jgi:NADPH:quinone reductase-like Zn-dependent oxidoreductase
MKTVELREPGYAGLAIVDREEPVPAAGQVLVRVRAMSLNYRDIMVVKGTYNPKMKVPMTPLSDCAGEVVGTGERVCIAFMPAWLDGEVDEVKARSALGAGGLGVASEYVAVDRSATVPIPDHLSFEEAATLPCAGVTAWNTLVSTGHVRPDEIVLIQGTGGVSIFALQFARLMKARVIATSSSDEKLEHVRELGASDTINYRTTPDWDKAARDLTGGRGVDHVIDVGGAGTLPKSIKAVRMGGKISIMGVLAGAGDINFVPIFMRHIRLQGIFVGSREMFVDMNRAIAMHLLRPVVHRVFSMTELAGALQFMESGAHFGKICVRWD